MLHTKPRGHLPFGSGEEDFWRVFTIYMGVAAILVTDTDPANKLSFPIPLRLHMKFCFDRPSGFGEDLKKLWTTDGRTTTDRRRTDDGSWLYYKLTNEPDVFSSPYLDKQTKLHYETYSSFRFWRFFTLLLFFKTCISIQSWFLKTP